GRGAVVTGRIGFGGVSAAAVCGLGLLVAVCSLGIRFRGGGVDRRGVLGLAVVRFRVPLGVDCQLLRSRVRGFLAVGCRTVGVDRGCAVQLVGEDRELLGGLHIRGMLRRAVVGVAVGAGRFRDSLHGRVFVDRVVGVDWVGVLRRSRRTVLRLGGW